MANDQEGRAARGGGRPNLIDYAQDAARFSWSEARREVERRSGGKGINIAAVAVDHHVREGRGKHAALRWLSTRGQNRTYSYGELSELSNRFSNALAGLGVEKGERVFTLMNRVPELYIAALGIWKRGAVFSPLFSAFGPEPIKARMAIARTEGSCHDRTRFFDARSKPILGELPFLKTSSWSEAGKAAWTSTRSLPAASGPARSRRPTRTTSPSSISRAARPAGRRARCTCTRPRSAHRATAEFALDLKPDDVFWCTADPGWVTGTSYGIIAPLSDRLHHDLRRGGVRCRTLVREPRTRAEGDASGTPRRRRSGC